jgi:hypothetical protein
LIESSTSEQKAIEERLLNERDPLSKAKQNLVIANAAVEKELEEQLTTQDHIALSLEIRDRKISPVLQQTKQT